MPGAFRRVAEHLGNMSELKWLISCSKIVSTDDSSSLRCAKNVDESTFSRWPYKWFPQ